MPDLKAHQLIYTNVEANQSPHGVRGIQLWAHSEKIPSPVVVEARRRLESFKNPDPKFGAIRRHLFAEIVPNWFLLAETTPQDKVDMFGRKGRFHAHSLILEATEFQQVFFNPFWILNTFTFDQSPEESIQRCNPNLAKTIPEVTIRCDQEPEVPPSLEDPIFLRWIDEFIPRWLVASPKDRIPTCQGEAPDVLLRRLKTMFHLLPASVRRQISFDTICFGSPLAANYFTVANPDERQAPILTGFRFHYLNKQGETRVKLPPQKDTAEWSWLKQYLKESQKHSLDEQDRENTFLLLKQIHQPKNHESIELPLLSQKSIEFLERTSDVKMIIHEIAKQSVRRRVPEAFSGSLQKFGHILVQRYLKLPFAEQLNLIQFGYNPNKFHKDLLTVFKNRHQPLTIADQQVIKEWISDAPHQYQVEIQLMLDRWASSPQQFEHCLQALRNPDTSDHFPDYLSWCVATTKIDLHDANRDQQMLETLLSTSDLDVATIRNLQIINLLAQREPEVFEEVDYQKPDSTTNEEIDEYPDFVNSDDAILDEGIIQVDPMDFGPMVEEANRSISNDSIEESELKSGQINHQSHNQQFSIDTIRGWAINSLIEARLSTDVSIASIFNNRNRVAEFLADQWFSMLPVWTHYVYYVKNQGLATPKSHLIGVQFNLKSSAQDPFTLRLLEGLFQNYFFINRTRQIACPFLEPDNRKFAIDRYPDKNAVQQIVQAWKKAQSQVGYDTTAFNWLVQLIKNSSDSVFECVSNQFLLNKLNNRMENFRIDELPDFFLGFEVYPKNPHEGEATMMLFHAVMSTLIPHHMWGGNVKPAIVEMSNHQRYRFEWLLRRIVYFPATMRLPLQQP